jgi:hypothetical protein
MGDFGRLICLANAEHVLSVFDFYFAVLLALRALPSAINLKTTNASGGLGGSHLCHSHERQSARKALDQ